MEVVTPNGEVIRASKTENPDVFWAARGSGQCFFGVVTRFWGKTIPARRLFERVRVFDCTDSFAEVVHWVFDVNDRTQKEGVEIAAATFRPDKEVERLGDEVGDTRIFMGMFQRDYRKASWLQFPSRRKAGTSYSKPKTGSLQQGTGRDGNATAS
ncbi:hypothetical protein AWENTII_001782 [Aspergillus wentii]